MDHNIFWEYAESCEVTVSQNIELDHNYEANLDFEEKRNISIRGSLPRHISF